MPTATGMLPIEARTALSPLAERARARGAAVESREGQVTIRSSAGVVTAAAHPRGVQISVAATETQQMSALVDLINGFCATAFDAVPHWMGLQPPKMTMTRVVSIRQISPNFRRVRLAGDFSAFMDGQSAHFRFVLGPEGADWPRTGEAGVEWPGGIDAWHRPPYTIVALDPEGRWLDTDVFVHEGGRVTEWTATAQPGDAMLIAGPGGKAVRQAPWLGLVGDETALPVILRALKAAEPGTRGHAFVLVPDLADAQEVALPDGLSLTWIARGAGVDLLSLLHRLSLPDGPRSAFFAGERSEATAAREIAAAMGLGPDEFRAATYWTAGR
ncbi:siderophore-interacting protein [Pararhodobacter zhoushanensis]|uniref:Siderophore-interacting protein n=1 Tax=Pararhodobacter zhoushanensis TaxID=2479545 RepID=A0ABT3H579_9RHOB|nr:siderophore-interacting protein [Pararhodobacter zhoushanensis]MCW1934937.1 siderophore-interacting protein [Pararhodobacter zhoushanensis]